jgi:hypothetical protein
MRVLEHPNFVARPPPYLCGDTCLTCGR